MNRNSALSPWRYSICCSFVGVWGSPWGSALRALLLSTPVSFIGFESFYPSLHIFLSCAHFFSSFYPPPPIPLPALYYGVAQEASQRRGKAITSELGRIQSRGKEGVLSIMHDLPHRNLWLLYRTDAVPTWLYDHIICSHNIMTTSKWVTLLWEELHSNFSFLSYNSSHYQRVFLLYKSINMNFLLISSAGWNEKVHFFITFQNCLKTTFFWGFSFPQVEVKGFTFSQNNHKVFMACKCQIWWAWMDPRVECEVSQRFSTVLLKFFSI